MKKYSNVVRIVMMLVLSGLTGSCAFNFALTSQRTALENQVMGTYQELEDDLVLVASVRGNSKNSEPLTLKEKASFATQNRKFNQDDIDELKADGALGEANSGELVLLPAGTGNIDNLQSEIRKLSRILIEEENRDRAVQWEYTIVSNENLTAADLKNVREAFAKLQRDRANSGEWIQTEDGKWIQKTIVKKVETTEDPIEDE